MTIKLELAKGEFKGNLKETNQIYKVNYLPIVKENGEVKIGDFTQSKLEGF